MPLRVKLLDLATGRSLDHGWRPGAPLPALAAGSLLWLDLEDPSPQEVQGLGEALGLPRLVVEDLLHAHQRPKLERHGAQAFLVWYALHPPAQPPGPHPLHPHGHHGAMGHAEAHQELAMVMGPSFVATFHHGPVEAWAGLLEDLQPAPELAPEASAYLAYLLLDATIDGYFPAVEVLDEQVAHLETQLLAGRASLPLASLSHLKRKTLQTRRLVTPLRDTFLVLMRGASSPFGPLTSAHFQDLLDHLLRVSDALDLQRDLLAGAIELSQNMAANRTNETMRQLTVISTVLMAVTLIAGIYGMNFARMPELTWPLGYPTALWCMALVAYLVAMAFARQQAKVLGQPKAQAREARRPWWWTGGLALAGTGLALASWTWHHHHAHLADYQGLSLGATEAECRHRLGTPDDSGQLEAGPEGERLQLRWSHWRGGRLVLDFAHGRLVRKQAEGLPP